MDNFKVHVLDFLSRHDANPIDIDFVILDKNNWVSPTDFIAAPVEVLWPNINVEFTTHWLNIPIEFRIVLKDSRWVDYRYKRFSMHVPTRCKPPNERTFFFCKFQN